MTNFLFLGQVPFTNLYINFYVWLELVIGLGTAAWLVYRHRWELPAWLLALYIAWLIRRKKLAL